MRDIDLTHVAAVGPPAEPVDNAYVKASPGGILSTTTATDPAFTDTKEYGRPSLGGDFGPGRAAILGADADGGAADLAADTTVTVTAPIVPTPPIIWPGRSANNTSFLNLFPWHKTPPEGLDSNNPNPPVAPAPSPPPSPPSGIDMPVLQLVGNDGTVQFSGPADRDAIVTLHYAIDGGPEQTIDIPVAMGDTGTQIAAKVRNTIDPTFGIDATGTGGTVDVVGLGGNLTTFNVTIA